MSVIYGDGAYFGGGDPYELFRALVSRSMTEVTAQMLAGVTVIEKYAFSYLTELTSVVIPDCVTAIRGGAFAYSTTAATSATVTIGNGVPAIEVDAFRNCTKMTSVDIGTAVTSIGTRGFYNCSGLTSFTCRAANPPTIYDNTLSGVNENCVFYVPSGSVAAYKAATNWSAVADRIQAIPS